MSARSEGASTRVGQILRDEAPLLDELSRARLERRFLDAATARAESSGAASPTATPSGAEGRRGRAAWRAAGAGGLAVVAAAAVYALALRDEGPSYSIERVRGGAIAAGTVIEVGAGEEARADVFDLGLAASAGARVRFLAVSRDDVRLELSSGEVRFAFHPEERGRQHVTIETPSARVEIVGTELSVRVEAHATSVTVTEGRVRVVPVHGGEPAFVSGGESLRVEDARADEGAGEIDGSARGAGAVVERARGTSASGADESDASLLPADAEATTGGTTADEAATTAASEASVEVLETAPLSPRARLDRAEMMLDADPETARRELTALTGAASPRAVRVDAHSLLGESYAEAHEIEAALRAYAEAARLGRGTAGGATALFDGARLSERTGDTLAAREGFERYLREYPDGANAVQARNRLDALAGAGGH